MTANLAISTLLLFAVLFIVGAALCLPLYGWSPRRLGASRLWIKILWWIPIFIIFELCLWGGVWICALVAGLLMIQALREYWPWRHLGGLFIPGYVGLVLIGLTYLPLYFVFVPAQAVQALIIVGFASVMSDVCAFFMGSFAGRHHLPGWINPGKSWEGVIGQILGGYIGAGLVVMILGIPAGWWWALAIGAASAAGDIANSIAKRKLNIKDWGQTIPGHGGVLDRFASLSAALAAGFWLTLILAG